MTTSRFTAAAILVFVVLAAVSPAFAGTAIRKSVIALDSISPGTSEYPEIDKKLLDAVDIIDRMSEENKWADVRKMIDMPDFRNSRYYDELVYVYLAHVENLKETWNRSNYYEREKLWEMMNGLRTGVHLIPAMLGRIFSGNNVSPKELSLLLDYIESSPPDLQLHGPMIEGNVLFGSKVREDFSGGDLPRLFSLQDYRESPRPLPGFSEKTQYLALLELSGRVGGYNRNRTGTLAELYQKGGNREKAAAAFYLIAAHDYAAKQYQTANRMILKSVVNNPGDPQANELKKKIDLALVLTSTKERINFVRTYQGAINEKYPIEMRIRRDGAELNGRYFYRKIGTNITLKGTVTDGDRFVMREYDANGRQTGIFRGSFVSDSRLAGTWSKPDGNKSMPFSVTSIDQE